MATHSDACQVRTSTADGSGSNMVYLGTLGHVQGLSFGSILPGGDNQMNCLLQLEPGDRPSALNPGRLTEVVRGAGPVWTGYLAEPVPTAEGWTVAATGNGVKGADYVDYYTDPLRIDPATTTIHSTTVTNAHAVATDLYRDLSGKGIPDGTTIIRVSPGAYWIISSPATISGAQLLSVGGWTLNSPVDEAITRGLNWVNPGITDGWWVNNSDNASISITEHLNNITAKAGMTWFVDRWQNLQAGPLPSAVTHILTSTDPVPRTLYADINSFWVKYTVSDNAQGQTVFGYTPFTDTVAAAVHGTHESYIDVTNAGVLTKAAAQAVAQNLLLKYMRAAWAGPFTVRPGQLLNVGGAPVDLAMQRVGDMVCSLMLADAPYGGEVTAGPITFPVGEYTYDDDAQLASITPVQSYRTDLSAILSDTYRWANQ